MHGMKRSGTMERNNRTNCICMYSCPRTIGNLDTMCMNAWIGRLILNTELRHCKLRCGFVYFCLVHGDLSGDADVHGMWRQRA